MIVVGKFVGKHSLAAVGATGSLINLMVNLFMGLSVVPSVIVSARIRCTGTMMQSVVPFILPLQSVSSGEFFVMIVGLIFCEPLLRIHGHS